MDNIADEHIRFDKDGICNYYYEYKEAEKKQVFTGPEGELRLKKIVDEIKLRGRGNDYDCLIGLSGGVDSSYVAWVVKQHGLRPLAVHLDNGWNSELAVKNIEQIIQKLDIDLYTLVVNWDEFKDIQMSFLKASVVDIEMVSDHAIFATMYKLAKNKNIGYIISGTNVVTEQIMPPGWLYKKMDFANLKDIHRRFGSIPLKTYPSFGFKKHIYYSAILKLTPISILNYLPYNKDEVKKVLTEKLGWRDYGGKHYESVFTKFYQSYILPEKFHIDKRKAHLSNLICSNQMSRETALKLLDEPLLSGAELVESKEYVLKKLGLSADEFDRIMKQPPNRHESFKSDQHLHKLYMDFLIRTANFRRLFKRKTLAS